MTTTKEFDPATATLEEAKVQLQQQLMNGTHCPCCAQFCKIYRRPITSTMAWSLILIYRFFQANPNEPWLHVPDYLVKVKADSSVAGGDVAKLRFWDLLQRKVDVRPDGSDRVGYYRITEPGRNFVEGRSAVPKYIFTYNQGVLHRSSEMTTIQEALANKFNYNDLMNGTI